MLPPSLKRMRVQRRRREGRAYDAFVAGEAPVGVHVHGWDAMLWALRPPYICMIHLKSHLRSIYLPYIDVGVLSQVQCHVTLGTSPDRRQLVSPCPQLAYAVFGTQPAHDTAVLHQVQRGSRRRASRPIARLPDCPLSFLCNGAQTFASPALLVRGLNECAIVNYRWVCPHSQAVDDNQAVHSSAISSPGAGSDADSALRRRGQRPTCRKVKRASLDRKHPFPRALDIHLPYSSTF